MCHDQVLNLFRRRANEPVIGKRLQDMRSCVIPVTAAGADYLMTLPAHPLSENLGIHKTLSSFNIACFCQAVLMFISICPYRWEAEKIVFPALPWLQSHLMFSMGSGAI